jgi:5-carboxymethyl-2-hydroxymuconate isomerase
MPHLIIEHSANISDKSIQFLQGEIQNIMDSCDGDFDSNQCKCRSISFDNYFVGRLKQENSSFIHITLKVLTGRSIAVRRELSKKISHFTNLFFTDLKIANKRCDISVDIAEMMRDTYHKTSLEG